MGLPALQTSACLISPEKWHLLLQIPCLPPFHAADTCGSGGILTASFFSMRRGRPGPSSVVQTYTDTIVVYAAREEARPAPAGTKRKHTPLRWAPSAYAPLPGLVGGHACPQALKARQGEAPGPGAGRAAQGQVRGPAFFPCWLARGLRICISACPCFQGV